MQNQLEIIRKRFTADSYSKLHGIVLDNLTGDTVRMSMKLTDDKNNWFEKVHGGAIYTLADAAFSVLANNGNNLSVALECSITYHTAPKPGANLVVKGETLALSRRTGSYLFRVFMEEGGALIPVATMKSVSYRTGKPIDPGLGQ